MDQLIDTTNTKIYWNKTRKSTISIPFQHHTEETSKLRFLRNKSNVPILLANADDIQIITRQFNTMDIILQHMITNLKSFGMEINPDKSSISIRSLITPSTRSTYQIAGLNIKTIKKIKYPGTYPTNGLNRPHTISDRLHQARGTSKPLISFLKKTNPSLNLVKKNI
jgi:hypothetical protein